MRSTVLAFLLLSARGGVAALAAWLVCRALRRAHAPSRFLCWLWLAVGLRFVLPWGIPLKLPRPESAPLAAAADTVQELGELPLLPPTPAAAAAAAAAGVGGSSGSSPSSCTVSAAAASGALSGRGSFSGMPHGSTNRSPTASHSQHRNRLGAWARRRALQTSHAASAATPPRALNSKKARTVLRMAIPPYSGRRRAVRGSRRPRRR